MSIRATYVRNRPDFTEIRRVFRDENGPVGRDLDDMSRRVLVAAQRGVGVRTGRLLLTIRRGPHEVGPRGPHRDVIAGRRGITNYLGDHMYGTPRHVIRPRRKRALRFTSGGAVIFARRVNHPGTRANPFLTRALDVLH